MEFMDYNYFASANHQAYQYLGFDTDSAAIQHSDALSTQGLDGSLDTTAFLNNGFDYAVFTNPLNDASSTSSLPPTSASPPTKSISLQSNNSMDSGVAVDPESEQYGRRSSSEEKESMTPAQSRRKAQNRAAQRAFRERKERHVRDLEAKLNLLTSTTSSLQSDNERLKLMLQRAQTENEILRATAASMSGSPTSHSQPPPFVDDPALRPSKRSSVFEEPRFDTAKLANGLLTSPPSTGSSPKAGSGQPGSSVGNGDSQLLSASATWDLLQSHPLYLSGAVDIGEICERLKKMAKCEGMGPMFEEEEVRKVIEEVGRSGNDELI